MTEQDLFKKLEASFKENMGQDFALEKARNFGRFRTDFFGIFDWIIVWKETGVVWFIQITTTPHLTDRIKKIEHKFVKLGFRIPNAMIYHYDEPADKWYVQYV